MKTAVLNTKTASADILASTVSGVVMGWSLQIAGTVTSKPCVVDIRDGAGGDTGNLIDSAEVLVNEVQNGTGGNNAGALRRSVVLPNGSSGFKFTDGLRLKITQGSGTTNVSVSVAVYYEPGV